MTRDLLYRDLDLGQGFLFRDLGRVVEVELPRGAGRYKAVFVHPGKKPFVDLFHPGVGARMEHREEPAAQKGSDLNPGVVKTDQANDRDRNLDVGVHLPVLLVVADEHDRPGRVMCGWTAGCVNLPKQS